jgi:hypothetical protein
MNRAFEYGDYIINKRGTIARINGINWGGEDGIKLRCVSTTTNKYTEKKGTPYTFQSITTKTSLKKNWKLISTEDVLRALWKYAK